MVKINLIEKWMLISTGEVFNDVCWMKQLYWDSTDHTTRCPRCWCWTLVWTGCSETPLVVCKTAQCWCYLAMHSVKLYSINKCKHIGHFKQLNAFFVVHIAIKVMTFAEKMQCLFQHATFFQLNLLISKNIKPLTV